MNVLVGITGGIVAIGGVGTRLVDPGVDGSGVGTDVLLERSHGNRRDVGGEIDFEREVAFILEAVFIEPW